MPEQRDVKIVAWPEEAAKVEHAFADGEAVPVRLAFDDTPVAVVVATGEQPLDVNMAMTVRADKPVPVCISVCEPICATSDYTVGISIFDNPFASIRVRGETKIAPCTDRPAPVETCVDFRRLEADTEYETALSHGGLRFVSLGEPLRVVTWGEPAGQSKLGFRPTGLRVEFPAPVRDVRLVLGCYAKPELDISVYGPGGRIAQFTELIDNETRPVAIALSGVTAVEVRGGGGEAYLAEVCATPEQL